MSSALNFYFTGKHKFLVSMPCSFSLSIQDSVVVYNLTLTQSHLTFSFPGLTTLQFKWVSSHRMSLFFNGFVSVSKMPLPRTQLFSFEHYAIMSVPFGCALILAKGYIISPSNTLSLCSVPICFEIYTFSLMLQNV